MRFGLVGFEAHVRIFSGGGRPTRKGHITVAKFSISSDALVLAGIPEPDTKKYYTRVDHYVACSRAKHVLEIIFDRSL